MFVRVRPRSDQPLLHIRTRAARVVGFRRACGTVRPKRSFLAEMREKDLKMNEISIDLLAGNPPTSTSNHPISSSIVATLVPALLVALLATTVSLCIATYTGWQRGGSPVEQVINVALADLAVLYVHLLLTCWRILGVGSRIASAAVWCVAICVVMYGQVFFVILAQQHAGNQRAAFVPTTLMPKYIDITHGRDLTDIAGDVGRVSAELARAQFSDCREHCMALAVRKATLTARLGALNTEADEARRREAEEDRFAARAERDEALRARLRADPVASWIALWFGTTESQIRLLLAVASTVALEGAAIVGWTLVSVALGRDAGRNAIASGRELGELGALDGDPAVGMDSSRVVVSEDDQLVEQIHRAVVAGKLKPTQDSIRKFLHCGQPKAGSLNRLYLARFGSARG